MFGFELQTNANLFTKGVKPREVAWRSLLVTLEGDETWDDPNASELEFVTVPCPDLNTALEAIAVATRLATRLRKDAEGNNGIVRFNKGESYGDGLWELTGEAKIGNVPFEAQPQVTVGVPLSAMRKFVTAVLENLGDGETLDHLRGMAERAQKTVMPHYNVPDSAELDGFLAACHYFLLRAKALDADFFKVDAQGRPSTPRNHDSWRVFEYQSEYLTAAGFGTGHGATARVLVNRDSPKSLFVLLHRTDFHSMFTMIPEGVRTHITPKVLNELLWPYAKPEFLLFPFPYRADPLDRYSEPPAARRTGKGWLDAEGKVDSTNKREDWDLMEHGPTFGEWCASIIAGRVSNDPGSIGQVRSKDLASPPRGLRGRPYDVHKEFPKKDEDKSSYYGMGVFPADPNNGGTPLAVYEHRDLRSDRTIAHLLSQRNRLVAAADWENLVKTLCGAYLTFGTT